MESDWGVTTIGQLILMAHSLRVHDSFSILAITSKPDLALAVGKYLFDLRWCRVEKCPKLHAVFAPCTKGWHYSFPHMETIWVSISKQLAAFIANNWGIWGRIRLWSTAEHTLSQLPAAQVCPPNLIIHLTQPGDSPNSPLR